MVTQKSMGIHKKGKSPAKVNIQHNIQIRQQERKSSQDIEMNHVKPNTKIGSEKNLDKPRTINRASTKKDSNKNVYLKSRLKKDDLNHQKSWSIGSLPQVNSKETSSKNINIRSYPKIQNSSPTYFHTKQKCEPKHVEVIENFQSLPSPIIASSKYKNSGFQNEDSENIVSRPNQSNLYHKTKSNEK